MKTGECRHCGERFPLALRQGKDSHRARAGRERSYQDQRYCSATCRKLASKARRARSGTPVTGPITRVATHDDGTVAPCVLSLSSFTLWLGPSRPRWLV